MIQADSRALAAQVNFLNTISFFRPWNVILCHLFQIQIPLLTMWYVRDWLLLSLPDVCAAETNLLDRLSLASPQHLIKHWIITHDNSVMCTIRFNCIHLDAVEANKLANIGRKPHWPFFSPRWDQVKYASLTFESKVLLKMLTWNGCHHNLCQKWPRHSLCPWS